MKDYNFDRLDKQSLKLSNDIYDLTLDFVIQNVSGKKISRSKYEKQLSSLINDNKYYNGISKDMTTQIEALYEDVEKVLKNYTPISEYGINLEYDKIVATSKQVNNTAIKSAGKLYNDYASIILTDVANGTLSISAVPSKFRTLTNNGLAYVIDSSGRKWGIDSYMRMFIRSENQILAKKRREEYMKDNGLRFFKSSKHSHRPPRKGCKAGEGKLIAESGNTKFKQLDGTYITALTKSEANIGPADGLFGINCTHSSAPVAYGLSQIT